MEDSTDTITTPQNDRIECPCRNFAAMSKIVDVLDSEDRMKSLLEWLAGGTDDIALSQNKLLSCGKRSRCRFRYGTSFAILNAIRDSCRPFLEPPAISTGTLTEEEKKEEAPKAPVTTYEEAFPVLTKSKVVGLPAATKPHPAASNILVPRKKVESKTAEPVNIVATKKKAKRRIRPQPAAANTPINSVWGQQSTDSTSTFDRNHGNTGNLPSQDPLSPGRKMNLTPTKKDGAINETTIEHQGNIATLSSQRFVTPVKKNRGSQPPLGAGSLNSAENQRSIDEICRKETQGFSTETNVAKKAPEEHLMRLIDIYMALIQNLLIPSTALELHLLLRMLMVDTEVCYKPLFDLDAYPFFEAVFCNPIRCKNFAKLALTKLNQVIQNLCTPLVKLFVRCEPFCRACPELAKDLSEVLEERIRHGLLADYSSEAVTGTHAILNIPFEEERDSRHNYRTQAEISVYKNREESRDSFLYELRAFMNVKGKLLKPQEMEKAQERVRQEARNIMNRLLSVNMVWFAQFFCELILQVGLSPVEETDQELLSIADKDTLQVREREESNIHISALFKTRILTLLSYANRDFTKDFLAGALIQIRAAKS